MRHIGLTAAGLLLVLLGCSEEASNFTVETRDGVPHAINRGWNVWSDSAAAPIQFVHEETFGTNEGTGPDFLGDVRNIAVDSSQTVYVLHDENHRLIAFNPDGTVKWAGGREGEGPGEFQNPRGVLVRKDRLYVENSLGRQLDVWTADGDFIERHSFADTDLRVPNAIGFADGFLVVSETGFGDDPQRIHALDSGSWEIKHTFPLPSELDLPERFALSASVTTTNDSLYVSRVSDYVLTRYAVDGTRSRRISRQVDILLEPGIYESANSRSMLPYSYLGAPLQLETGHLLVNATWASNVDDPDAHFRQSQNDRAEDIVWATTLDLFSANGRYLGSLRWDDRREPPIGSPELIGPNGKLYTTTNDPFPQVRRYDVTVTEP